MSIFCIGRVLYVIQDFKSIFYLYTHIIQRKLPIPKKNILLLYCCMFRIAFILSISTFSIHILIQCIIVGNHSIHSKYHQRHEKLIAYMPFSIPLYTYSNFFLYFVLSPSMSFYVERLILTEYPTGNTVRW